MKKKKLCGGIFSAALASVIFCQSMTALAVSAPSDIDNLSDNDDGWEALGGYMDEICNDPNVIIYDTSTQLSDAKKYFESGVYIVPYSKVNAAESALEGGNWSDAKDAVKAVYQNSVEADGSYCISDDMFEKEAAIWGKIEEIDAKCSSDVIIVVGADEEEPDVAAMDQGTYWCKESEMDAFWSSVESANGSMDTYRNGDDWKTVEIYFYDGSDSGTFAEVSKSAFESYVSGLESAYNTLVGQLQEGTREVTRSSGSKRLKKISDSEQDSSAEVSQQEEESMPALVNEVVFANGTRQQPSIDGIYSRTFAAGTIFKDEKAKISQAAGLSEEEMKNGASVKYYICTSMNQEMNKQLSGAVTEQGYKIWGVMNCDLYKLYKGEVTKIRTTNQSLTVIIGVPETLRSDKYEFMVFGYDESGKLVTMQDMDTDINTITVQASTFGCWAVGYKTK